MDIVFPYESVCEKTIAFHKSPARRKALIGGWGCGKTTAVCAEGFLLAMEFPKNLVVICRNTFGELDRSTRLVFQDLCPTEAVAKAYSVTDHTIHLINGSTILFFPLDDVSKLKSLNAGTVIIDEASEIDEEMATTLWARRGRRVGIPAARQCFLVASNPTLTNHWMYRWFAEKVHPDFFLEKMTTYDNKKNLPDGYIQDLEKSLPPDMFQRFVMGEWGHVTFGERIYPEFSLSIHVGFPEYDPAYPIVRCWDFGYLHPALVFLQVDSKGKVMVLKELMGKNVMIENFAEEVIYTGQQMFPGARFEDYGDPAGGKHASTGVTDTTAFSVLIDKFNINVHSRIVGIKDGLDLVRRKLSILVEGSPAILIHKDRCKLLIEGMAGGYACMKTQQGEVLKDLPKTDGYYEHTQDALRYGMINKFATDLKQFNARKKGLPVYKPTFSGTSY